MMFVYQKELEQLPSTKKKQTTTPDLPPRTNVTVGNRLQIALDRAGEMQRRTERSKGAGA